MSDLFFAYENKYYKQIEETGKADTRYAGGWCFDEFLANGKDCVPDFWSSPDTLSKDTTYIKDLVHRILEAAYHNLKDKYTLPLDLKGFKRLYYAWSYNVIFKIYGSWKIVDACGPGVRSYTFDIDYQKILSQNLLDANLVYYFSDWNAYIFSEILKYRKIESTPLQWEHEEPKPVNKKSRELLIRAYQFVLFARMYLKNKNEKKHRVLYYFSKHYDLLPSIQKNPSGSSYIQLIYTKFKREMQRVKVDDKMRNGQKLLFAFQNEFERFLSTIYFKLVPVSLMEGIPVLERYRLNKFYGSKHEKIVYSDFMSNELLLYYLKDVRQPDFFVYQHGGGFGLNNHTNNEIIEKEYAPQYLTWGWKRDEKDIPFFAPTVQPHKIVSLERKEMCVVLYDSPPFIPIFQPTIYSSRFGEYLVALRNFVQGSACRNEIALRFYPRNDSGVNLMSFFSNPANVDSSKTISDFYSKYRLYIYTYNSTGFLELWHLNIPCILFIGEENLFTDEKSAPYYDRLKENNLLFTDHDAMNAFLDTHFNRIEEWWQSAPVQENIVSFLSVYYDTIPENSRSYAGDKAWDEGDFAKIKKAFDVRA